MAGGQGLGVRADPFRRSCGVMDTYSIRRTGGLGSCIPSEEVLWEMCGNGAVGFQQHEVRPAIPGIVIAKGT